MEQQGVDEKFKQLFEYVSQGKAIISVYTYAHKHGYDSVSLVWS